MKEGFRQAMAWLHTWTGLVFGWLLFAIFLTGTLSYFKDEITHWMQPEIQVGSSTPEATVQVAQDYLQLHAPHASRWFISMPQVRQPALEVTWQEPGEKGGRRNFVNKLLDPRTATEINVRDTASGEFFYRFHFQLQMPHPWGRWLATAAAMMMFIALITGIITHKKIFKDFFTFRPRKGQRSWLDGHNALGVLVLPFHLMITFSSLVIFMYMVMPASIVAAYGNDTRSFFNELFPATNAAGPAGQAAPLTALAPLVTEAIHGWGGVPVGRITVSNPGDLNASVSIDRDEAGSIARQTRGAQFFNGVTGAPVVQADADDSSATLMVAGTFYGLHLGRFAGPLVRWMYFVVGLAGTAMIGTGLVIWLGKRQLKHAKSASMPFELRLVEVLNIASMSGLVVAIAGFFWANRLLPVSLAERADWEVNTFFILWGLSVIHALLRRGRSAWVEQLSLGALLFTAIPLLNALTTQGHLGNAIARGDWVMAGFDLTCLVTGLFLGWAAWKMRPSTAPAKARVERAPRHALQEEVN